MASEASPAPARARSMPKLSTITTTELFALSAERVHILHMLRRFRIWLNRPLAEALEALEGAQCAQAKDFANLVQAWSKAETELDGTYRRVHSELGYIDKRSADLRKLEAAAEDVQNDVSARGPFSGGRQKHESRRTR